MESSTQLTIPIYLMLHTDCGLDHRLPYLSVQLTVIAVFLLGDLDFAVRTRPYHSWCNPVERIMSILNLALQSVELMRTNMDQKFEQAISKCKSMENVSQQAEAIPGVQDAFIDSIEPASKPV